MKGIFPTCLCAAMALALTYTSLSANAGKAHYRWEDDRGNPVHSDVPPPKGTPYEVISTSSSLVRKVTADEGAVPAETVPSPSNEFEQTETKRQGVEKNPEQCSRARQNLETLNSKVRINIRDENGELRALSEEEKAEQVRLANESIAAHCD